MRTFLYIVRWAFVATIVGLCSSVVVIAFSWVVERLWDSLSHLSFDVLSFPLLYFAPAAAGLAVGALIYLIDEDCAGSGVRITLQYIVGAKIPRMITVPFKFISTVLTLASGGSGGMDGPALQMGYGLGNYFARIFRISDREAPDIMRICGATAALGTLLQTPIGAAVFVLEAFRRRLLEYRYLVPAIIANTTGYALSLRLLPRHAVFGTARYIPSLRTLFLAAVVGVLTAGVGVVFMRGFKRLYTAFLRLPAPLWVKPAIGGAMVGVLAFLLVRAFSISQDSVMSDCIYPLHYVIDLRLSFTALVAILVGRIATTLFTVTSRMSAGVITPAMFAGALVGAAVASASSVGPTPLALAGIAASLSAVFNAPLGAILIVTEMSGINYAAPAALAAFVAYVLAWSENILEYRGYVDMEDWI